jgi:hypothetical protein
LINYHKITIQSKLDISAGSDIPDGTVWSELQYSFSEEGIASSRRFVFNLVAILGRGEQTVFVHDLFNTAVGSPDHMRSMFH